MRDFGAQLFPAGTAGDDVLRHLRHRPGAVRVPGRPRRRAAGAVRRAGCFAAAALLGRRRRGSTGLMLAAALAGVGNSPFHPVDFTILNKRVSPARLGHAFSVHGISGNLGWAAAPVFLLGVVQLTGSWRWALLASAAWALVGAGADHLAARRHRRPLASAANGGRCRQRRRRARLRSCGCLRCGCASRSSSSRPCALSAIQSFAGPALAQMYGPAALDHGLRRHRLHVVPALSAWW